MPLRFSPMLRYWGMFSMWCSGMEMASVRQPCACAILCRLQMAVAICSRVSPLPKSFVPTSTAPTRRTHTYAGRVRCVCVRHGLDGRTNRRG